MSRTRPIPSAPVTEQFATLRGSYQLGESNRFMSRLRGVYPLGSGADYHYADDYKFYTAIERAREYDRSNMILGQGVNRAVNNALQDGIDPDPDSGDEEVNAVLKDRWWDWGSRPSACDAGRRLTIHQMAWLTCRSVYVDGDILHLLLKERGCLQPIEAHRLVTPNNTTRNVVHGVLLDELGGPVEYWIAPESQDRYHSIDRVKDVVKRPAFDENGEPLALHVYHPKRFSQTRGISIFNPIALALGMLDDLHFANLVKAQVAACTTIFRELPESASLIPRAPLGPQEDQEMSDGSTRRVEGLFPGMEIEGRPGEKLIGFTPNVPNPEFFEHSSMILGFIAATLDLPVCVLLLDPTKTNFSGWRGALDQARIGFRKIQEWMINGFYAPVYRWKVRQWLTPVDAESRAFAELVRRTGADPFSVKWPLPRWRYIDPLKDALGDAMRLEKCLSSPRRVAAERGEEWKEIVLEIGEDEKLLWATMALAARELNQEFPELKIDAREMIHRQTTQSVAAVAMTEQQNAQTNETQLQLRRSVG